MRDFTCVIIEQDAKESAKLQELISQIENTKVIGVAGNLKDAIHLLDNLEPNLLFLSLKGDDLSAFKTLEKIKKQPTIVLIAEKKSTYIGTFETSGLNYLTKPVTEKDLQSLFAKLNQTHHQLAQKMQSLLGKLKFED